MMRFSYVVGGLGNEWDIQAEQAQLNEMGQQGWELVAVIVKPLKGTPATFYYFRREIREHDDADAENARFPRENKQK
jgi:hypothetical protein